MQTTFRLKMHDAKNLDGFISVLTSNGYSVKFREGGNARILMCDVSDDKCKLRGTEDEDSDDRNGQQG